MQTENRWLDDLARVASGALGVAAGVRSEIEAHLRDQFERILTQMDLVTREEFEVVRAMAIKAREEQEELAARVARLEAVLAVQTGAGAKAASKARPRRRRAKSSAGAAGETKTKGEDEDGSSRP